MLDNPSQLLLRHDLVTTTTLLVNAQDALSRQYGCRAHFYYANLYQQYAAEQDQFGAELAPGLLPSDVDQVILYVPKEKSLCRMLFDNLAVIMPSESTLYLVGANKGGIKSIVKHLPDSFSSAQKVASGNHCLLYMCQRTPSAVAPFKLSDYQTSYQLPGEPTIEVFNLPGVFSEQRLDAGTALLLEYIAARPKIHGRVLDFACGSGPISAFVRAHCNIDSIIASDVNAFTLKAAEQTLQAQQQDSPFEVLASDGLNAVSGRYDWIITNPPFHTGQRTDYDIASKFINEVAKKLKPGGRLLIVANSFLGYNALLHERFRDVQEPLNNGRYKILEARTPC